MSGETPGRPGWLQRLIGPGKAAPASDAPPGFTGPRRYVTTAHARYQDLVAAAEAYTWNIPPEHRTGLLLKPLDAARGHVHYLRAIYNALNIIQKLDLPGGTILDAGAGPGWLAEQFLMIGYRVILLEPSQDMLDIARQRIERASVKWEIDMLARAEFVKGTIEDLPPALEGSASVQAVVFHEAWHHVIDEHRAARNVFGLLAPGGQMAVLGESRWNPGDRALEDLLDAEMASYGTLESPFTRDYMIHVLREAGFVEIDFLHALNGFFPAADGTRTVEEVVGDGHERGWNTCLARRPRALRPGELDPDRTHARFEVVQVARIGAGMVRISLRAENTGQTLWRAGAGRGEGLVTMGVIGTHPSGEGEQELMSRGQLERDVAPGESLVITGEFPLADSRAPYHASLVAEGSFWFRERIRVPLA
ncbi:MAG: methyltransferase domain-containing protein [Roseococcus sp.]|nr:methyltransferase domain-containing protein [Roseococcus sp.]